MRWELAVGILVGLGSLAYLVRWGLRNFERAPRHYLKRWDGTHATCACGHHSPWDYNLRKHFEEQERAGK